MIKIKIKNDFINIARLKSKDLGILRNSIREGEGNFYGFLGELVVADYFNVDVTNTYDYDIIINDLKCDVKTKQCTSPPRNNYDCSVAAYNTKQLCDVYIFTRICNDDCWILGWLSKPHYFKKSVFLQKGMIDPSNNFKVKADCYNVKIFDLYDIQTLKNFNITKENDIQSNFIKQVSV